MRAMTHLPIDSVLPSLIEALTIEPRLVLMAPPGAGKSTRLPLVLLEHAHGIGLSGQIWLLEPRRLAAEQVANQLAKGLGEKIGQRVGLMTGDKTTVSSANRLVVMTEGILSQRLLQDNEILECGLILFDEFHERNVATDLGLALALQCQDYLRDDLKLVIMSATLDQAGLGQALNAPVIQSEGKSYPVEIHYRPQALDWDVASATSHAIHHALSCHQGDLLVFLPGIYEIQKVMGTLQARYEGDPNINILMLHGQMAAKDQQQVLNSQKTASAKRHVILATDIAKTSLTLENVTVVIDSGLERLAQFDKRTAMDQLITLGASQASMIQRAGRAGRVQAGHCYRLLSEDQFRQRPAFTPCGLEREELSDFCLTLSAWGSLKLDEYFLLNPPKAADIQFTLSLLQQLDAIDQANAEATITDHGRAMAGLPVSARLAHLLLHCPADQAFTACHLAALLAEGDPLRFDQPNSDLSVRMELLGVSHTPRQFAHGQVMTQKVARIKKKALDLWRKLTHSRDHLSSSQFHLDQLDRLLMLVYPDRIAQKRGQGYRLANGSGAQFASHDVSLTSDFLVVAHLSSGAQKQATIRLGINTSKAAIADAIAQHIEESIEVNEDTFDKVTCRKIGQVILEQSTAKATAAQVAQFKQAQWLDAIRRSGLAELDLTPEQQQFIARLRLLQKHLGDAIPSFTDDALSAEWDIWLEPFLNQNHAVNLNEALLARVPWDYQRSLETLVPPSLELPSGRSVPIDYCEPTPTVACKLQECFGLAQSPQILSGAVTVCIHLLSPAQRPLAQTTDLAFFWREVYPSVRKENRGRYAKHPWPEDPLSAVATQKTKRHLSS